MLPLFVAMGRVWAWVLGAAIYKIFTILGVGFIVYYGVKELIDSTFALINSKLTAGFIDVRVTQVFGMLHLDDAVAVIASAWAIRLTLVGLVTATGAIRKLRTGLGGGG